MASVVSVSIRHGAKIVLPWTIIEGFSHGCTFNEMYTSMVNDKLDLGGWKFPDEYKHCNVSVSIGKDKIDFDQTVMSSKIATTVPIFGHYVRYSLHDMAIPQKNDDTDNQKSSCNVPKRNINEVLMMGAKKLSLPDPYTEDCKLVNNKRLLHNKILLMLENAGLGFTPMGLNDGKEFITALTNCIWNLDPHKDKLRDRSITIPVTFDHLFGYNIPENHKHKRTEINQSTLMSLVQHLDHCLEQPWINKTMWSTIKSAATDLSESIHRYVDYLKAATNRMNTNRQKIFPVWDQDETKTVLVIHPCYVVKPGAASRYKSLVDCIEKLQQFTPVCIDEYTPLNTRERRYFLDNLKHGMPFKCIHLKFAAGNNLGSHNFLWRIPSNISEKDDLFMQKNTDIIQSLTKDLPSFHTRAMRRTFINKASVVCNLKQSDARYIYKFLTGDSAMSENTTEKEIDLRVQQAFEMEDPDIITDLRLHNVGQPSKYKTFFDKAKQYLENVVETAVDERRHDLFTHLATAISVPDLLQQVKDTCSEDTLIPSEQWLRLQFAPKNPSALASLQYTGNLKVKFQVQSRQLRKTHTDNHYASAIFRYLKDFAVKFRNVSSLVAMDDKHHCKVGEPGHPVAAVDRGKRVVVSSDKIFAVSDHDFTKFSVVPSVTMLIDIPESVSEGSFYRGQVYVGVKDLVLEPSSPLRHIAELQDILMGEGITKPILCLYTDGGPDHRLTYLSVQLSIISLFLRGNFDMIVAARTPPMASWKNPPERIMSILNLALQSVGLMRRETSDICERRLKSANGLSQLRDLSKDPVLRSEMVDSIEPVKTLLTQLFRRLKLKEKQFNCFTAASQDALLDLWGELSVFGDPPDIHGMRQQDLRKSLKNCPKLVEFMEHCCVARAYFFTVRKCGDSGCQICAPPRLPCDVFSQLHNFPDPVPGEEEHYKKFADVYGTSTTEEHCPSLAKPKASVANGHGIPFSPSAQTAKTVKKTVTCTECEKPRVVYCAKKLSGQENTILDMVLGFYQYSCGSELQELQPEDPEKAPKINALLEKVYVRANLSCKMPIETSYFSSAIFPPVCYHCGAQDPDKKDGQYPMCTQCETDQLQPALKRRNVQSLREAKQAKK